jgi:hypothetical protein
LALREIEDAPHFFWTAPVKEENREFVARFGRNLTVVLVSKFTF